jgi:hypothetical protein
VPLLDVKPDRRAKRTRKLVSEWPARTRGVCRFVAHWAAQYVHAELLEKIPKGDWDAYRESLKVARVSGDLGGATAFAVYSSPKARKVREVDEPKTLLYIRSRRRLKRVKPEIEVLEKYSPWTLQTLPFTPKRSDAQVISRTATEREVNKVTRARQKDRKLWRPELIRLGVPVPITRVEAAQLPRTVPDVAFEATRLEFGFGVKGVPHWRPAIARLTGAGLSELRRDPGVRSAFTKPAFTDWRGWEKIDTSTRIRSGDARKFLPFQTKLGIRSQR